jgi:glycosyltransferase involved in cell wall biosynthesis
VSRFLGPMTRTPSPPRCMSEPLGPVSRPRGGDGQPHFIYVTETDLSVDNGPGINEREFVDALCEHWPEDVTCVAPYPLHPATHLNPHVEYVASHGRRAAGYPGYLLTAIRRIRRLIRSRGSAAVVFRFGATPLVPYFFTRVGSTPVILKTLAPLAALGPTMRLGRVRHALSSFLRPAYHRVVGSALAADTVSVPYRDWICARYDISPDRIAIIPNGANTDVFSPGDGVLAKRDLGLHRFDRVIGYVGALSKIRYVDQLIRALKQLGAGGTTGMVLVGAGSERSVLEDLARDEGVSDQVVFVGSVPYSRVPDYVRAFDVAVDLTSVEMEIEGQTVLSSFSQKIPQYLACGVPVVAWRCGDTDFLVKEGAGGVAGFRDEADLTRVLGSLIALDAPDRDRMRERARQLVEARFSTVKLAERRLDWWRAVAASPTPPASGQVRT